MSRPIPDIMAIDTVVNIMTPEALKYRPDDRKEFFVDKMHVDDDTYKGVTLDQMLRRMDDAGIERGFLVASRSGPEYIKYCSQIPYELVADAVKKHPDRFSGLAGLDPTWLHKGVKEFERAIVDLGFIGAHFYPHWFELPPDHAKWYPFYDKCVELDVPVQLQVGQSLVYSPSYPRRSVGRPICLDQVACDFPELKLIGIHCGIPWTQEMIAMAWKHKNIHIITDAHSPKYWPQELVHYINTYGQDKVMFGTDFPVLQFKRTLQEIADLGLRPHALQKLIRDNAKKLYKLK